MAKKKTKAAAAKKPTGYSFNVQSVLKNINEKNFERNQERIEKRVRVMVESLAKREGETDHYRGRTEKMLAGLGTVKNAAQLERWFQKGF